MPILLTQKRAFLPVQGMLVITGQTFLFVDRYVLFHRPFHLPVRVIFPELDEQTLETFRKGYSGRKVHWWLKEEKKFTTKNGKYLSLGNIYKILCNSFYYGVFEYPWGGGNWYQGKHTPLITKEVFEAVQEKLDQDTGDKSKRKEFPFTNLMKCGECGSGITAMEKFKKLKGGGTNRYVYYGCTRSRDPKCDNRYIREEELVEQLLAIMDKLSLDKFGMREKIERKVRQHLEFERSILGKDTKNIKPKEIDIRNYAKYVLRSKSDLEKRELLSCLKSKIIIKNKMVAIEE